MKRKTLNRIFTIGAAMAASVGIASSVLADDAADVSSFWECPSSGLYFCDDFSSNSAENWLLYPDNNNSLKPNGEFDIVVDDGNAMLRHTAGTSGGIIAIAKPDSLNNVPGADYYVEAKIRPRFNSSAANKQLYLLARYQDGNNWYAGALNVQNSVGSTQVEIAKMTNGALSRMKKVKSPIVQGQKNALDGQWYSLRFVVKGNELTVYLDGDKLASLTDDTFAEAGNIGLWTANKSFEIDDIKVGNANDIPASLVISPSDSEYSAEVGDSERVITVVATTEEATDDSFTVTSSDSNVVEVQTVDNTVTLVPVGAGTATVTFRSGSNLVRTVNASITPAFVMPTATYNFTNQLTPLPGEFNAYEDTQLTIKFDSEPTLGEGSIRIFRASDDVLVDKVSLVNETDAIGFDKVRNLKTNPIRINGNTVSVTLHSNKLENGVNYYVAVSDTAFLNAKLAGSVFEGIGKQSAWAFTTRLTKPDVNKTELLVDYHDHKADFRTIQGALNFVMENVAVDTPATINIKNGVYEEPLYLVGKNNVTIKGETKHGTIIQYKNNEGMNSGSSARAVFLIEKADLITLDNLTLKNTTLIGDGHQAETITFNSPDGRLIVTNSAFISEQDTLHLKGWTWFYNTLVAGNVDFIWGYSKASLFENSEIRTLGDSRGNGNGGYVLQARVQDEGDVGYVFLNSRLTRGNGPLGDPAVDKKTYLGRSGGCSGCYDNIIFVNTKMDNHIRTIGWLDEPLPTPNVASASSGWREFNSMDLNGNARDISGRLATHSYELTESEVVSSYCNRAQIFSAYNGGEGWNPMPENTDDCGLKGGNNENGSTTNTDISSSAAKPTAAAAKLAGANSEPQTNGLPTFVEQFVANAEVVSTLAELEAAVAAATPGDVIYVRQGQYTPSLPIVIEKSGTAEQAIVLSGYPGDDRPLFDFSAMTEGSFNRGIEMHADYWHIYGIDIQGAGDNGMHVTGSHNTIEFMTFRDNADTGLQLDNGASYNFIKNSDSYFNADSTLENADGFAAKLGVGTGNYFYGCRTWQNLDDGFDGYLRNNDQGIFTTWEYSWMIRNGYQKDGSKGVGDGNGFKTGGSDGKDLAHNGLYINTIAAGNTKDGYDQNSNRGDVTLYNAVAYGNNRNYGLNDGELRNLNKLVVKNSVSLNGTSSDKFGATTTDISNNSWQQGGATSADFRSINVDELLAPRKSDGSLPDVKFFNLADASLLIDSGVDVGLSYNGAAPDLGAFETH